ncbi:GNAT family N-acetyltransferase [Cetobacterium sp.]|uniref:GNAT family N-acetyltransferase n=1 Tax=Cetobacterium sp. TaxID=2071632 RepID=UPI003F2EB53D
MNKFLKSNNLVFNLVEEEDANFILQLRSTESLNKYLSKSVVTEEAQKTWIREYKKREIEKKEYYFRIDKKDGEQLGFVRLYDISYEKNTFTWGSWIIKEGRPPYSAIESALIIYEYAFNELGMSKAIFDVRKENIGVLKFHKKFGAITLAEDELNEYFELPKENYEEKRDSKYKKYLLER